MSKPLLVSVVMCTYNGSRFINEQVQSILDQEYQNFELIIVDDCSTDNTPELLLIWQNKDQRITVHQNENNLGYNKNFEKAIQLGRGDLIALADQDDIWLPQRISKTVAQFKLPGVVLAHSKSVRLEGTQLKYHLAKLHYHFSGSDTRKLFFFNQVMGHDMTFSKELVKHIVPIPKGMSYDWWIAVIATCYGNIAAVDEYLVHHRIHSTNNFFSKGSTSKKKELDLVETLEIFRTIPSLKENAKTHLEQEIALLRSHENKDGFDWNLFRFLFANRYLVFGHKRRNLRELSYLKNAIKYAKIDYKGRGISI
ncbi:MAG: glycosyltransferase [Chitinophagaceae bacterium]|nr:glycosyltransferase [Chitinophagaceae bacterium]